MARENPDNDLQLSTYLNCDPKLIKELKNELEPYGLTHERFDLIDLLHSALEYKKSGKVKKHLEALVDTLMNILKQGEVPEETPKQPNSIVIEQHDVADQVRAATVDVVELNFEGSALDTADMIETIETLLGKYGLQRDELLFAVCGDSELDDLLRTGIVSSMEVMKKIAQKEKDIPSDARKLMELSLILNDFNDEFSEKNFSDATYKYEEPVLAFFQKDQFDSYGTNYYMKKNRAANPRKTLRLVVKLKF